MPGTSISTSVVAAQQQAHAFTAHAVDDDAARKDRRRRSGRACRHRRAPPAIARCSARHRRTEQAQQCGDVEAAARPADAFDQRRIPGSTHRDADEILNSRQDVRTGLACGAGPRRERVGRHRRLDGGNHQIVAAEPRPHRHVVHHARRLELAEKRHEAAFAHVDDAPVDDLFAVFTPGEANVEKARVQRRKREFRHGSSRTDLGRLPPARAWSTVDGRPGITAISSARHGKFVRAA
jgi:hypothetical protein